MLHELLLALSGIPGSIFVLTPNEKDSAQEDIQVITTLSFIHPCEREALNRVCRLGSAYFKLKKFIAEHTHFGVPRNPDSVEQDDNDQTCYQGLYIRAFCEGLNKVLTPYRKILLKLEMEILEDPYLGISHIQSSLEQYNVLFPSLLSLTKELTSHHVHGCAILDVIHQHSASGICYVNAAMKILQHACHEVMFKQLSSWILNGILLDPYNEFFVQKCSKTEVQNMTEETQNVTESTIAGFMVKVKEKEDDDANSRPKFSLRGKMIPSYIPLRLVETIMFIGESIQVFEGKDILGKQARKYSSIFQHREEEFSRELNMLQRQNELQFSKFDAVIDAVRSSVAEHLWTLVVENSDLYGHLKALRDFFLLGRGELFLAFMDQASHFLNAVPSTNTKHDHCEKDYIETCPSALNTRRTKLRRYDINNAFRVAAHSVLSEDGAYFEKFYFSIDQQPKKGLQHSEIQPFGTSGFVASTWNFLRMNYVPPKPLHILFTPIVLEKYNAIFRFLLNITRVQMELQKCWELQIEAKHRKESVGNTQQWHLRTCMAFLVENLLYYLQVDVLETQFTILMDKIKGTRDFEQIQLAHHTFLTSVSAQTFLLMKTVSHCLQEFLKFCLTYCTVLKNYTKMTSAELQSFTTNFQRHSSMIFHLISGLPSHQAGPLLSQLALRIDFNKYFSEGNRHLRYK